MGNHEGLTNRVYNIFDIGEKIISRTHSLLKPVLHYWSLFLSIVRIPGFSRGVLVCVISGKLLYKSGPDCGRFNKISMPILPNMSHFMDEYISNPAEVSSFRNDSELTPCDRNTKC